MQGQCTTEIKGQPAIPEKVAELVAAWEKGPASSACFFALFLAVFIAADAASQNLRFEAINIVAVLLSDVTAKVFEGPANQGAVKCGHAVPGAGMIDLNLNFCRFLMIVFASFVTSFAPFAGFLTEHHSTIGMWGRNAISMFMLNLYSIQPLHSRVDLVYARAGKTALPLAGEKWGGMVVTTAVNKLRVKWQTNQFLAPAFPEAAEGFLAMTVGDCVLGMLNQPVTPINLASGG